MSQQFSLPPDAKARMEMLRKNQAASVRREDSNIARERKLRLSPFGHAPRGTTSDKDSEHD